MQRTIRAARLARPRQSWLHSALRWLRIGAFSAFAAVVAGCGATTTSVGAQCNQAGQAQMAACDGTGRCYGIARWITTATSAQSNITTAALNCGAAACGSSPYLEDGLWLSDNNDNWVETGYTTAVPVSGGGSYTSYQYFWADNRASTSGGYHAHALGSSSIAEPNPDYSITKNGTSRFDVSIAGNWTGTSSSNALDTTCDKTDIGLEEVDKAHPNVQPNCGRNAVSTPFSAQAAYFSPPQSQGNANLIVPSNSPLIAGWQSTGQLQTQCT